eukprot:SAG31_NODE_8684_length_1406_cov_1.638868_1_plen_107_part_10
MISIEDFLDQQLMNEQNWFARFNCDVVLDASGLTSLRSPSVELLQPGGHYLDLNGHGIRTIDNVGLLQGVVQAGAILAEESTVLRRKGCRYHWVLFKENHEVGKLDT